MPRSRSSLAPVLARLTLSLMLLAGVLTAPVLTTAQDATPESNGDLGVTPILSPTDHDAYGDQFGGSPAPTLPVTVTGLDGVEVTIVDTSRVVSLSGSVTEIVFALGLGDLVVGVDVSARYPGGATSQLPQVGYVREISAEGVLSLDPTLVIGNSEVGPPEVVEQLRSAGVPVLIIDAPEESIDAPAAKTRAVAEALGVPDRGEQLAGEIEGRIAEAADLAAGVGEQPRVAFLYLRTGVQLLAGANSSADTVITGAGAINVGAEIGLEGYVPVTPEALVEAAPDVILVMTDGLEATGGVDGLLEIPGITETPAGANVAVVAVDDLYLLGNGPRTGLVLIDLVYAFHPDLVRPTDMPAATPTA